MPGGYIPMKQTRPAGPRITMRCRMFGHKEGLRMHVQTLIVETYCTRDMCDYILNVERLRPRGI